MYFIASTHRATGFSPSLMAFSKALAQHLQQLVIDHCKTTIPHRPMGVMRIFTVSFNLFIRHYWGYHGYFLFHRLIICLSSAGNLI
jgi:hypothetical protein